MDDSERQYHLDQTSRLREQVRQLLDDEKTIESVQHLIVRAEEHENLALGRTEWDRSRHDPIPIGTCVVVINRVMVGFPPGPMTKLPDQLGFVISGPWDGWYLIAMEERMYDPAAAFHRVPASDVKRLETT